MMMNKLKFKITVCAVIVFMAGVNIAFADDITDEIIRKIKSGTGSYGPPQQQSVPKQDTVEVQSQSTVDTVDASGLMVKKLDIAPLDFDTIQNDLKYFLTNQDAELVHLGSVNQIIVKDTPTAIRQIEEFIRQAKEIYGRQFKYEIKLGEKNNIYTGIVGVNKTVGFGEYNRMIIRPKGRDCYTVLILNIITNTIHSADIYLSEGKPEYKLNFTEKGGGIEVTLKEL